MSVWGTPTVERYRLCEEVGSGGMGRVWRARDLLLERDVAVKEIVPPTWLTAAQRSELQAAALREARTAAQLNHPNVMRIYDVVRAVDPPWIVMEFVPCRTLYEVIVRDGPLNPKDVANIGLSLLAALDAAHRVGVLHRDVKPHNVLMADDGRVLLSDFGLAVFDDGAGDRTGSAQILASPQYVAPERARDGVSTIEADLWSLGATLYAAVQGQAPFARPTAEATLTALAAESMPPATLAGGLRPVLDGLLRKDPRRRMSAAEAERRLRWVADPDPELAPLAASPPRRALPRPARRVWVLVAAAALALAAGLAAAVVVASRDDVATAARGARVLATAPAVSPCVGLAEVALSPPVSAAAGPYALPAGWLWRQDPLGFRVGVPAGWSAFTDDSVVCFRDPAGTRVLAVDPYPERTRQPLVVWQDEERRLVDSGRLPGYARVTMDLVIFQQGGADWEYTWEPGNGQRLHALRRLFATSPTQAYVLTWVTRDADWELNEPNFQVIARSFQSMR